MKTKPRFLQSKPRLELATDEEVFKEFMKRVTAKGDVQYCYFIDSTWDDGWEIHRGGEKPFLNINK